MNALIWLIAIAVGIVGAVLILSVPIAIFRVTKARGFTQDMLPLLIMSIVLMIAWVAAVAIFNPLIIALVAFVGAIPSFFAVKKLTPNKDTTNEVVKLSTSHVALLAGSFLFLIPFAWLISTSLKSDDEQATFPPVWIPTQQVTADTLKNTEGDSAPLSYYFKAEAPMDSVILGEKPAEGTPIQVAEVADLPTGEIRVQPVSMALDGTQVKTEGTAFVTGRDHLAKIRPGRAALEKLLGSSRISAARNALRPHLFGKHAVPHLDDRYRHAAFVIIGGLCVFAFGMAGARFVIRSFAGHDDDSRRGHDDAAIFDFPLAGLD